MTEPMVVVRVIGGPRCGERFATPLDGLTEGLLFRYIENHHTFVRDAKSGRWAAMPYPPDQDSANHPDDLTNRHQPGYDPAC